MTTIGAILTICYVVAVLCYVDLPHPHNKIGDGPEGPEVHSAADKLRPLLLNSYITSVVLGPNFKGEGFHNMRYPARIIEVRAHGKKLIIDLDTEMMIITSLGMTGRLCYNAQDHIHATFNIADVRQTNTSAMRVLSPLPPLYFQDSRRFGNVNVVLNTHVHMYFSDIGPDLVQLSLNEGTWITPEQWLTIFCTKRNQNKEIWNVLMDQSLVSGIGHYLQTDMLYYAQIHPERKCSSLTVDDWERLRVVAHKVISLSYACGGHTIESFINPDGTPGCYPAAVYGKQVDPSGNYIEHKKKGGRTLHWVPSLQY